MPRLQKCRFAVVERDRREIRPPFLLIGGRSIGGRAASMLAADGFECDGLLHLAYPLHPAGQVQKRRAAHLKRIRVPVLCFKGTRDALCRQDLMEGDVRSLASGWTMHWLEGADHGIHVTKSSGRADAEALSEIVETSRDSLTRRVLRKEKAGG